MSTLQTSPHTAIKDVTKIRHTNPALKRHSSPMTDTKFMSHGASSGNGVYLADDLSIALGYAERAGARGPAWARGSRVLGPASTAASRAQAAASAAATAAATAAAASAAAAWESAANPGSFAASASAARAAAAATWAAAAAASAANAVSPAAVGGGVNGTVDAEREPLSIVAICEVIDR